MTSILNLHKDKWVIEPITGCCLWKGAVNSKGYPVVTVFVDNAPKVKYVNRLVCEEIHGPPPTPNHQAAHQPPCFRRNCVIHLYWATQSQNEMDKPAGVRKRVAKYASDIRWGR